MRDLAYSELFLVGGAASGNPDCIDYDPTLDPSSPLYNCDTFLGFGGGGSAITVTPPTGSDPNYEITVNSNVNFKCNVGNIPFVGSFGSPSGTLAAGTHLTLTPASYSQVNSHCTFTPS